MTALLAFMPDEMLVLVPVVLGLLVMTRLIPAGVAFSILISLSIMIAMIPLISSILDFLPLWALILMLVIFGYSIAMSILSVALGKGVTDYFFGRMIYDIFLFPFRLLRWILRNLLRGVVR